MRLDRALVVYRKELLDMLRDRRTIFGTLIFPLILFPLMSVGFGALVEKSAKNVRKEVTQVMLLGEEHAPQLAQVLRNAEGLRIVPSAPDYVQQISSKKLRAAVELPAGFEAAIANGGAEPPRVKIYYYSTEMRSESAVSRLEEILRNYRNSVVEKRLGTRGLSPAILKPVAAERENVAAAEKVGGMRLAGLIPYFLVILCLIGAMHPAMDLTAGEKERGTLETILASAISRGELVLGKFLMILSASLTTTMLGILSFSLTVIFAKSYLDEMTQGHSFSISLRSAASVLLLALPLAVLFSGALMALSLRAKSYREAQSLIGPLMIVVVLPAVVGMLPGVELNARLAVVPILNVSLVAKEVLIGNFPWGMIGLVFASSCAYAALALSAAVNMFQREEVLFRA
jgi:sodium transport system permease protein